MLPYEKYVQEPVCESCGHPLKAHRPKCLVMAQADNVTSETQPCDCKGEE